MFVCIRPGTSRSPPELEAPGSVFSTLNCFRHGGKVNFFWCRNQWMITSAVPTRGAEKPCRQFKGLRPMPPTPWSLHKCRLQSCWLQGCRVAGCRAASCRGEGCKGCATSCRAAVHATAVSTPTQAWTLAEEYLILGPELPNTEWWWVLRVSLCGIGCSPACVGGSSERGPGEGRAHRPGHLWGEYLIP